MALYLGRNRVTIGQFLANAKGEIDLSALTAIDASVLQGIVYVGANGQSTGTMPNQTNFSGTIDGINEESCTIPRGYHDGTKSVSLTNDISNEVITQDILIAEISSILEGKKSAYPEITFDESTGTLTIKEVAQ